MTLRGWPRAHDESVKTMESPAFKTDDRLDTVATLDALRARIRQWRVDNRRIGFVPTMGNLHEGHLALLEMAQAENDVTVVSIFVNPIQFGRGEDYARYPSTLEADRGALAARGADLLFTPDLDALYPGGTDEDTRITVPGLSDILCGSFRPGHFSGVATVVAKLFANVQPDAAYFGEKDFQQVLVIRRMVRDLCLPVAIRTVPVVREESGLAMSSRNAYLTPAERAAAATLYRTLCDCARQIVAGAPAAAVLAAGRAALEDAGFRPEYLELRRAEDLGEPTPETSALRLLGAAWLGAARLIDNVAVQRPSGAASSSTVADSAS